MVFLNKNFQNSLFLWAALSLIVFILLGFVAATFKLPFILNIDNAIGNFILSCQTISGVQFWSAVTFLGNKETIIALAILLIIIFSFLKKYAYVIILATTVVGAELSGLLSKNLFHRIRPVTALPDGSFSFPSGHATISMAFYGLLIYLVWKSIGSKSWRSGLVVILSLLILCIGFSRLYLGMHFFTDVLGGYFLGLAWIIIGINTGKVFLRKKNDYITKR